MIFLGSAVCRKCQSGRWERGHTASDLSRSTQSLLERVCLPPSWQTSYHTRCESEGLSMIEVSCHFLSGRTCTVCPRSSHSESMRCTHRWASRPFSSLGHGGWCLHQTLPCSCPRNASRSSFETPVAAVSSARHRNPSGFPNATSGTRSDARTICERHFQRPTSGVLGTSRRNPPSAFVHPMRPVLNCEGGELESRHPGRCRCRQGQKSQTSRQIVAARPATIPGQLLAKVQHQQRVALSCHKLQTPSRWSAWGPSHRYSTKSRW